MAFELLRKEFDEREERYRKELDEREERQRKELDERLNQQLRGFHLSGEVTNALGAYHEANDEGSEHVNSLIKQAQAQEVWIGSADKAYVLPEYSGGKEKEKTQDYVTSILSLYNAKETLPCKRDQRSKNSGEFLFNKPNAKAATFLHDIEDAHVTVSFRSRKPDIVCRQKGRGGEMAITMLGDVKGGISDGKEFSDDELSAVYHFSVDLLKDVQPDRDFVLSFLTDGKHFQFLLVSMRPRELGFQLSKSSVFNGMEGWMILTGLLTMVPEDLGYTLPTIKGVELVRSLGRGMSSTVYEGKAQNGTVVVKVYNRKKDDKISMSREKESLKKLHENLPPDISSCIPAYHSEGETSNHFGYLCVTPVGHPVPPCHGSIRGLFKPYHVRHLVAVVKHAHTSCKVVHRDIKPSNIYFTDRKGTDILLNDWASSVGISEYMSADHVWTKDYTEETRIEGETGESADLRAVVRSCCAMLHCKPESASFFQGGSGRGCWFKAMEAAKECDYDGVVENIKSVMT